MNAETSVWSLMVTQTAAGDWKATTWTNDPETLQPTELASCAVHHGSPVHLDQFITSAIERQRVDGAPRCGDCNSVLSGLACPACMTINDPQPPPKGH